MNLKSNLRTALIWALGSICLYYMFYAGSKHFVTFAVSLSGSLLAIGLYLKFEMDRIVKEQNERILQASKDFRSIH